MIEQYKGRAQVENTTLKLQTEALITKIRSALETDFLTDFCLLRKPLTYFLHSHEERSKMFIEGYAYRPRRIERINMVDKNLRNRR